jgi:hypothetical protein
MKDEVVEAMGCKLLNEFVEKKLKICMECVDTLRPYFKVLDVSLGAFHASSWATPHCVNILHLST